MMEVKQLDTGNLQLDFKFHNPLKRTDCLVITRENVDEEEVEQIERALKEESMFRDEFDDLVDLMIHANGGKVSKSAMNRIEETRRKLELAPLDLYYKSLGSRGS
jgi:hypothetical protein